MTERRAAPRRSPKSKLGLIRFLVALDIVVLGLVVYDAPVFKVARIHVDGTARIAPQAVLHAASVDGKNLLSLDVAAVGERLAQLHGVKSVVVERRLPNELRIRVVERLPVAVWVTESGRFLVDEEGVVLGKGGGVEPSVTVVDTTAEALAAGSRLRPGVVSQVRKLVDLLPGAGVTPRAFVYAGDIGLIVVTEQGWNARFGDPDNVEFKVAVLRQLVPLASAQRVELVDVQSPNRPYLR